eukprot:scaffold52787_cov60-Phaeocystis_antarctica.AAC.2
MYHPFGAASDAASDAARAREMATFMILIPLPERSRAVKSAALEAASSSTRGGGWASSGLDSSWECRAAQSHQARPEEAQEPSWGTANAGTLTMMPLPRSPLSGTMAMGGAVAPSACEG